jgi:hypothetical protein
MHLNGQPPRKQQANEKQGKTQHLIRQANPASKANPAPRQGKPKNNGQSFALVSDTKKQA